eukprot:SAG11_NODE_5174_length_1640_cov_1.878001_2_plen_64_part_00
MIYEDQDPDSSPENQWVEYSAPMGGDFSVVTLGFGLRSNYQTEEVWFDMLRLEGVGLGPPNMC